jgi:EAL domain-containing protein (putative c-di-GMP-specific phosphodiesterase class I)
VALDDVGAAPASLAVLPFVRPDLIKLDMRLLQGRTTAEAAHIVNTVRAQAERTDALVIAEGIETWWSPTTVSWSSGPPSRCCAGWFPSTDHRGIAEGWVV